MKTCPTCQTHKPLSDFYLSRTRKSGYAAICKRCECVKGKASRPQTNARYRADRRNPERRAKVVLRDCKNDDHKKGRNNDLTLEYVQVSVTSSCTYCGTSSIKMTLDRIDNSLGHLQINCIPACIRCNYIRRNMPYEAWLKLAPTIRTLVEDGSFDGWNYGISLSRQ